MAQFARPVGDIAVGNWSPFPADPTTLSDKINEVTPNGDTDYIVSSTDEDECEFSLSTITDPQTGVGHIIRCYARVLNGGGASEKITISLVENGTVRASSGSVNVNRTAYGLIEYALPGVEADAISDYTNLKFRIHIDRTDADEPIRVTQVGLKTPDAPTESITYNSVASGGSANQVLTYELVVDSGSNKILVVGCAIEDTSAAPTVSGVTWNETALTQVTGADITYDGGENRVDLWYLLNPEEGTYNIVVTLSGDPDRGQNSGAIVINGAKQQAPEAVASAAPAKDSSVSVNITTQTNNAWIIDCMSTAQTGRTTTAGGDQTERYEETSQMTTNGSTKPVASAGATTMSWGLGSATDAAICCASWEEYSAPPPSYISRVIVID